MKEDYLEVNISDLDLIEYLQKKYTYTESITDTMNSDIIINQRSLL